jgi:hypothetical protein
MSKLFTVGSMTGYPIRDDGSGGTRETTLWYVHARRWGFAMVQEFTGRNAEARARELAAILNAGELPPPRPPAAPKPPRYRRRPRTLEPIRIAEELEPWPYTLPKGDPRHGTVHAYNNIRCRCLSCRAANTRQHRDWMDREGRERGHR